MSQAYTKLKGISKITDVTISEQIVENLSMFFEWAFLSIGGFINVNNERLVHVDGGIWKAKRTSWVWETGIDFDYQPTQVTQITIDGIPFVNDGSTYQVSYKTGRILFHVPIPSTSNVRVSYSYKLINFYDADSDWFKNIMFNPMSAEIFETSLQRNNVFLPAVIIEQVPVRNFSAVQLGDSSQYMRQDILFHIISRTNEMRNKLVDAITFQKNKTIWLFDINKIAQSNAFQFNNDGTLNGEAISYPLLLELYKWKKCTIVNMFSQETSNNFPLSRAIIRSTFEVTV